MSLKEVYNVNTNFVHVFSEMFKSGEVKKLGAHTLMIYLAIKVHVNIHSGQSFPNIDTIREATGASERQIYKSLKELKEAGYITISKRKKTDGGFHSVYTLQEKFTMHDSEGNQTAIATFEYIPAMVKESMAQLKNFQMTGKEGTLINIKNLVLNLTYNNCTINQTAIHEAHTKFKKMKKIERFIDKSPKNATYVANLSNLDQ